MKLLLDHHHHDHHGRKDLQKAKKSHKLMKKLEKLEKKLSKYSFESAADSDGSASSCRSRSHSRSHHKQRGRRHHKHPRRFESYGRSSSSSSSDSSSDSSSSSSSDSSRSPSPAERHHRRRGPPRHLSRLKSFHGRHCSSPPTYGRFRHRHPSPTAEHQGRVWHHRHHSGRREDGIRRCIFKILGRHEHDLRDDVQAEQNGENRQEVADIRSRSASREPEVTATQEKIDEDIQEVDKDATELPETTVEGPEIDAELAENWTELIKKGLPADKKKALLTKYPVSRNCLLLRGPKINKQILPAATEAAVKKDTLQMQEQNEIGTGLAALGQAITNLNNKTDLKQDKEVLDIIETLNEAAAIILDAHHNITQTRQAFLQPELKKRVRSAVENCKADEFLYGDDFGEKIKNIKGYGKGRKAWKGQNPEGLCEKGEKRKHADHDEKRRYSRRLHHGLRKH